MDETGAFAEVSRVAGSCENRLPEPRHNRFRQQPHPYRGNPSFLRRACFDRPFAVVGNLGVRAAPLK